MSWIWEAWKESAAPKWREILDAEFEKPYMRELGDYLDQEAAAGKQILPPRHQIFRAFAQTDYNDIKVVILGQDPYHGPNQACGLAFSINEGEKFAPSLRNIFQEIESDTGVKAKGRSSDLGAWAEQGVMLLNTVLTVRQSEAFSHSKRGWEKFTRRAIEVLSERPEPLVFILWGKPAQAFKPLIASRHKILEAAHPSPLSASKGFFGCKHFSQANAFLQEQGKAPVTW